MESSKKNRNLSIVGIAFTHGARHGGVADGVDLEGLRVTHRPRPKDIQLGFCW